jgi:tetratricopeptide (TPR) repeat protein
MVLQRLGIPLSQRLLDGSPKSAFWARVLNALPLCVCLIAAITTSPAATAQTQVQVQVQTDAAAGPAAPVTNSDLDEQLLYQLLVAEMALNTGDAGSAYELILEAAKRKRDEGLFRRSVDIALQARAGEQALAATKAWRTASPTSLDAIRLQLQVLLMLNRPGSVAEPLNALLRQIPDVERPGLISALPRLLERASDAPGVAAVIEKALQPYREAPADEATRVAARVALGRAWLQAREPDRALALAREVQSLAPASPSAALLALDLMRERPPAEALVTEHLRRADADPAVRQAYVRQLMAAQRYGDAIAQLELTTQRQPEQPAAYLSLGALHLELKHVKEGEAALLRYLDLMQAQAEKGADPTPATSAAAAAVQDDDDDDTARSDSGLTQAWLMLAQSAEQRRDFAAAERWLAKVADPQRALEVQTRRAIMLARQGKMSQARALINGVPERRPEDGRAKLVAEATVLREVKQWRDAFEVLASANKRFIDDSDLLYEQAMVAEKLNRLTEMESLLRRVIALKPDNAHAHNALGYSLADRQLRLPEARQLVQRALELSPGDPFITDSLGWVEFRLGNRDEALRLLRRAYASRPDTEIAAHLGEVLWAAGQRDEARRVWREGKARDASNDVLRETLARLHADL